MGLEPDIIGPSTPVAGSAPQYTTQLWPVRGAWRGSTGSAVDVFPFRSSSVNLGKVRG